MPELSIILLRKAGLAFPPLLQTGISLMSGLGSIGYGLFWFLAGLLAPGMGSTGIAKETVGFVAQVSAGSFFIAVVGLFCMLGYKVFIQKISFNK